MVIGVISGCVLIPRSGKLSFGSRVNTDENWLFSISVTFHGIYMGSRGNYFIIGVSHACLGHLRMWRVQLS